MTDTRVCPQCGRENPVGQKSCSNCQTPLATDALFVPGQSPKQVDTGELEPMLPEWLRSARSDAKAADETSSNKIEVPPIQQQPRQPTPKPAAPASNIDFLSGLQSQADDEDDEDIPDWLTSITGAAKPKETVQTENPIDSAEGIKWTESSEGEADWLAGLQNSSTISTDEKDELTDFLQDTPAQQAPAFDPAAFSETTDGSSDWFSAGDEKQPKPADTGSFGSSNWFDQPQDESNSSGAFDLGSDDTPDWLKEMSDGEVEAPAELPSAQPSSGAFDLGSDDTPDWLKEMSGGEVEAPAELPSAQPSPGAFDLGSDDTPDWLKDMSGGEVEAPAELPSAQPSSGAFDLGSDDTPDWLKDMSGGMAPFVESTQSESDPLSSNKSYEEPSWLTPEAASAVDPFGASLEGEDVKDERAAGDGLFSAVPDWLRSAAPESTIFDEPEKNKPEELEGLSASVPFAETPAFDSNLPDGNDALFTEMPDWLSDAMESPATPEPIIGSDALAPNELPSWVEAMRPVEQTPNANEGMALASALSGNNSEPAEVQGVFAGLSGILPVGAGFAPTSKPKVHSIKINADEDQLKQAGILEQILAAETSPVTLASENVMRSSRILRFGLAFVMVVSVFLFAFMGTQIFSMPVGVPNELKTAVSIVQSIPPDAPVLVIFDYDPSRAGEMEVAATPLFDHMMILNHPRLTFISTNEYGSVLAERFISGPLAGRGYQSGVTYLNLGYLSGGHMGIRSFAQNPAQTITFDTSNQFAWTQPPLQGVTALNQFAAMILVTDDAEAARAWVEQTQELRGATPFLVVSSAQAAPMIQPYFESNQVQGMVSGLYGGAIVERQYNNGNPGTARRYWDGYSAGMLIAAILVFGGGLVNLFLGMRDRTAKREG
ncbi:MAG: hypothetical protein KDD74_13830 [Anaerolineales bacterium]|nr:hypothetical protein [Anaerolineales bacterium]